MTQRMMMLVIQLGVVLFAAKLGSIVFERLHFPGVLGELTAGILIGPYLLGRLPLPGFPEGIFPRMGDFPVSVELYAFCSVAAVVLLFLTGLETDTGLFLRYSVAGTLVGIGGVVASFVIGDALGVWFAPSLFGEARGYLDPSSLFLGIISTATSVGITARVLSERRKLDSPEGVTILAGAVVDDVLGIVLLALALGVLAASNTSGRVDWGHIGVLALKTVGIWLTATVVGLLASRRISRVLKGFGDRSSIATMALGLALIIAGLFEEAGLAMIVGAYVMGLSLSRADIAHVVREWLHPIYAFLVPIFFAGMGMLVNLPALFNRQVLTFGVVYTLAAILAKLVGCGVPTLFCGFNLRGALRVGVGMVPRGEVALIVAGIGLAAGMLPADVFGVGVLMTLATTLIAPPCLVFLFRSGQPGLRKPETPEQEEAPLEFTFPSSHTAELVVARLISIFEAEGFFAHTLNREENLYQLRKEGIVIGFQRRGPTIRFECHRRQRPYVAVAIYEVLADVEKTVQELRKPMDAHGVVNQMDAAGSTEPPAVALLGTHLTPRHCQPNLRAKTKMEAIDELLDILYRTGVVRDLRAARQAILEREACMATGMQHGIAIPHARTDAVESLGCAIGLKREGLDFGCLDGEPARIIILTVSPKTGPAPQVQLMATLGQILDAPTRARLLQCETPEEMYAVLVARNSAKSLSS